MTQTVGLKAPTNLKEVLRLHALWLNDGEIGERADLRETKLAGADLGEADLRRVNLVGANLRWADLRRANLEGANLREADLREANLIGANLREADLRWANLVGANLEGANLEGANLRWAVLEGANLEGANLEMADLDYAAWPLWCGSLGVKADRRLAAQLAYHFCRIDFGDDELCKGLQEALVPLANEFHRVGENGIPPIKERGRGPLTSVQI
ncbi:pentapeptide repeat-containing protein [Candidatus Darwinibacter acetoxidans]